jgi:NAD(P)-dependent dehydrogenase (short-subunit alcohol dehydrogenase family)
MPEHPAIEKGRVAVITGGASGIGLAAAERFAGLGMKVMMADLNAEVLEESVARVATRSGRKGEVIGIPTDVSKRADIEKLKERAYSAFGSVDVLMNNAGRGGGGAALFAEPERWKAVLDTNLWGVIHGVQVFALAMIAQKTDAAIVNTGSKQGITCPPGETAYNLSKAGVKVVTEALAHELRSIEGCRVTAHLLIPGFTFTGITRGERKEKPAGAWTAEQVVDFMLPKMAAGDFYILCPDNEVTRAIDEKRMRWAMDDIIANRPALSRWHADYKDAFAKFMAE